jgi:c-di-GMP-binding flagellar brake protein YcgR
MRGTAVRIEGDLVRFTVDGQPQIVQRRQFVRVIAPQPVTLDDDDGWVSDTRSLNISGGGMLVSGPAALDLDREIRFAISLGEELAPVTGLGRVVRAASDQQRAIVFEQIRQGDRERLIHFIFDRQRAALAITRGDTV